MSADTWILVISTVFHLILLFLVMRHKLMRFSLYLVWQLLQVPLFLFVYHHDLSSRYYWEIFRNWFILLRIVDYLLALLALNETICTEYHIIALGFEAWLGSQLIVLAVAVNNPQYWAKGENISNAIYLIACLLWMRILGGEPYEKA